MLHWRDLFTARQKVTLASISNVMRKVGGKKAEDVVAELLAFAADKFARHCNGNARWNNVIESVEPAFGSQTLLLLDLPESVPWGPWAENSTGLSTPSFNA